MIKNNKNPKESYENAAKSAVMTWFPASRENWELVFTGYLQEGPFGQSE